MELSSSGVGNISSQSDNKTDSSRHSLRRHIMVWSFCMAVAFVLLALCSLLVLNHIDRLADSELRNARRLQLASDFEETALGANRRPTAVNWRLADEALKHLQENEPSRAMVLAPIVIDYQGLKAKFDPREPQGDEKEFLDALRRYRAAELTQIRLETIQSDTLDRRARQGIMVLLVVVLLGLLAGGVELWARVFRPILLIAEEVRRFGGGDLTARVSVVSGDELGALSTTINNMAASIEEREKDRLRIVAAVAHDLKNPLTIVNGGAQMLQSTPEVYGDKENAEWVDAILESVHRMLAMIQDFTDAVQAHTGALQLRLGVCDLAQIARKAVAETEIAWPDHTLRYFGETSLFVDGDPARLERVIANLLSNAAKYSERGTTVTMRVEKLGDRAVVTVQDQGAGISSEDIPRLFTPFVRLERTQTMAQGTGLGLSSVKKIIEAHGGEMTVTSEVDVGSAFGFSLPLEG